MEETEWLFSANPTEMFKVLAGHKDRRKLHLFAVACARTVQHHMLDARSINALEVMERLIEGQATDAERVAAIHEAWRASEEARDTKDLATAAACDAAYRAINISSYSVANSGMRAASRATGKRAAVATVRATAYGHQAMLIRDIFGNPFQTKNLRSIWIHQCKRVLLWNSATVLAIAQSIYAEKCWDQLPILADAMEDAGCTVQPMLQHLRGPGPHARGCWVVDTIRGKDPVSPGYQP